MRRTFLRKVLDRNPDRKGETSLGRPVRNYVYEENQSYQRREQLSVISCWLVSVTGILKLSDSSGSSSVYLLLTWCPAERPVGCVGLNTGQRNLAAQLMVINIPEGLRKSTSCQRPLPWRLRVDTAERLQCHCQQSEVQPFLMFQFVVPPVTQSEKDTDRKHPTEGHNSMFVSEDVSHTQTHNSLEG